MANKTDEIIPIVLQEGQAKSINKVGDAIKEFNIRAKDGSKTSLEAFVLLGD